MTYISKPDSYQNIVSVNLDGHIQMERTDFYNSLRLNYVEFKVEFSVTKEGKIVQSTIYTAAGAVVGNGALDGVGSILGGTWGNVVSGEFISVLIIEVRDYVSEIISCDKVRGIKICTKL